MARTDYSRRRILQASGVAIATALAGCGGGGGGDGGSGGSADLTVALGGDPPYDPNPANISVGETIAWEAASGDHFLSVESAPDDGDWTGTGASAISGDQTHTHTFEVAGTYEYKSNQIPSTATVEVSE